MSRPVDLEIPIGKRTKLYRFFEIVPATISYGMVLLLIVLSIINPVLAALYLLLIILTTLVKAAGVAVSTIRGHNRLMSAQRVDWNARLKSLEAPARSYGAIKNEHSSGFQFERHKEYLKTLAQHPSKYPRPSELFQAVIIAAYNEAYDVIQPTIESVKNTTYNNKQIILCLAYEERGGAEIDKTVRRLQREYRDTFYHFMIVKHPKGLPNEVAGKGPNITYTGRVLKQWLAEKEIEASNVLVTTLDSDNRPHPAYFDYAAYEYIVHPNRKRLSYQPIALYFGNIWDAPAPMRVIATGNSFWTLITSMRPHTLRNFAAHSQPMDALIAMDFWSKRSIVEDGHQYWRSYFYFNGDYAVIPIYIPIYQDAVMGDTLKKTLVAQFKQQRRWAYGASDTPYVATHIFSKNRNVPFFEGLARLFRLVDSQITLATMSILVAFGGWVPLLINPEASRSITVHALPNVVSHIQQIAMVGVFITILLMLKMLPPRPERYKRRRTVAMVAQWALMPLTSVCYSSLTAFNAQTHLMLGKYLDKFDVTDKATLASQAKAREKKRQQKHAKSSR